MTTCYGARIPISDSDCCPLTCAAQARNRPVVNARMRRWMAGVSFFIERKLCTMAARRAGDQGAAWREPGATPAPGSEVPSASWRARAGEPALDGREEDRLVDDRLCDVVVDPRGQVALAIARHRVRGERDDGERAQPVVGPDPRQDL